MRYAFLTAALLALVPVSGAQATQIVNHDENAAYSLTILTPSGKTILEVAAGVVIEDVCPEGCALLLGEAEVLAKAEDTVSIEQGKISIDE